MINITPVVKQLIIINIIFYVGSNFFGNPDVVYKLLSLHEFHNPDFKVWQPVTHMFMHAKFPELGHILLNMFGLFMFGTPLEHFWGGKKFLIFYVICGLGAGLVHGLINFLEVNQVLHVLEQNGFKAADVFSLLNNSLYNDASWGEFASTQQIKNLYGNYYSMAVGASGAIYGLMVAFAFMFPNQAMMLIFLPIPIKAKYFIPAIVALDLFSGISGYGIFGGGNIAHFAHVGGALFGTLLIFLWRGNKFNQNRWN